MSMQQEGITLVASPNQGYFSSLPEWARKTAAAALAGLLAMTLSSCGTEQGCAMNIGQTKSVNLKESGKSLQQAVDEVPGINEGNCRQAVLNMVQRQLSSDSSGREMVELPSHVWSE